MRYLKQVSIATAFVAGTMFASANDVSANDRKWEREMLNNCPQVHQGGVPLRNCILRYGGNPDREMRRYRHQEAPEGRRYYDGYTWFEPVRPRHRENRRRPRHQDRYLYSRGDSVNQDLLAILGFGYGVAKAISEMDRPPHDGCRYYLNQYGEREAPVCD